MWDNTRTDIHLEIQKNRHSDVDRKFYTHNWKDRPSDGQSIKQTTTACTANPTDLHPMGN